MSAREQGTVKWFNDDKGFGFIVPDAGGADVFIHITDVKDAHYDTLDEGARIEYDLKEGFNGKVKAVKPKIIS
jgi:cold shock protein